MLDWSSIIVAIIAGVCTFAGAFFSNRKATALFTYRLDQLEEKVTQHNELVVRMTAVEHDIKTIFRLVDDLSEEVKK